MDKPINVLVVEQSDYDFAAFECACSGLQETGFLVQRVGLEAALTKLDQGVAQVVLSPFMEGQASVEPLQRILRHARTVPVVTLGPDDLALTAVVAGAEDHLSQKLLEPQSMATVLRLAIERRRRWQAMEASEARFSKLIQASADSLIIVDDAGMVRFANKAAEKLFDRKHDEFVGSMMGTPSGEAGVVELSIVRPETNETISAEMRVREIEWQGQTGYIESIRDVTQQKKEAQQALEAIRMRDHFLATLSHELRNPLAALSNAAQLLSLEQERFPSLEAITDVVQRQCHHMVRLLDDLLDISRISQGKVNLRKEFLPLNQWITDCLQVMESRIKRTHRLNVSLPKEDLYVHADPSRMQQVLVNLLTNAAKYTQAGGEIWLHAERINHEAVVVVGDQGHGISAEMLDLIFEPFVQAEQTLARSDGGLGIGLAVVRRLVELHGGRVQATSLGLGHGSQFIVHLPLANPPVAPFNTLAPTCSKSFRICVVEDSKDIAWMMRNLLEKLGHDVSVANEGLGGLELILTTSPDVAFLDIGLPGLTGYQVAEQVARDPRARDVILIALTGYGSSEDRQRAFDAGFHYHFVKPVSFASLQTCLAEIGNKKNLR
jgi:signal transduction histidine kinase/ActR/RegA family two-component response regulator